LLVVIVLTDGSFSVLNACYAQLYEKYHKHFVEVISRKVRY